MEAFLANVRIVQILHSPSLSIPFSFLHIVYLCCLAAVIFDLLYSSWSWNEVLSLWAFGFKASRLFRFGEILSLSCRGYIMVRV
jgi:hypothetical protein